MFYDFVISGCGLSGALIGKILQILGYSVFIFDKSSGIKKDFRTSAINKSSKEFLEKFNIWQKLEDFTQIKEIFTYEYNRAEFLHFESQKKDAMSYVVPNIELQKILYEDLEISYNTFYKNLYCSKDKVKLILNNNKIIEAKHLIATEGKNSGILKLLNILEFNSYYKQASIVCNLKGEGPHNNIAREIFIPNGIIALLPLKEDYEYSLIYTVNFNFPHSLRNSTEENFLNEVYQYSGIKFNKILTERACYPLSLHFVPKCYKKSIILIGDTVHSIHPVAGQGFNLTIADISSFVEILKNSGIIYFRYKLQEFSEERLKKNLQMAIFTDFLVRGFNVNNPIIKAGRNFALEFIDKNNSFKNFFIKKATTH